MQDLKIYICIEDPKTRRDVSIKGNFEILHAFLSKVGLLDIKADFVSVNSLPADDPKVCEGEAHVTS